MHILRSVALKSKCLLITKTLFKMHFMTYSSKKKLLMSIQKSHTPNIIVSCYRISILYYAKFMQYFHFWPGKDCIDCFLPDTWLEGMWIVFIFYFGILVCFLLQIFWFFRPTIADRLTFQDAIFVNFISLTFNRVFKPDLNKYS